VRRYAAVPGGALAQYPAGAHHPAVDPVRQSWYRRAVEFAGRVVVTGPTLDPAGSGYVVSVSHTPDPISAIESHRLYRDSIIRSFSSK